MGAGGPGTHRERPSDVAEAGGSRVGRNGMIPSDGWTAGGLKRREAAVAVSITNDKLECLEKSSDVTVYEDKRKKSSVHTALCLKRQESN